MGLRSLLATTGIAASEIGLVVHGTTLGTNAVIERTGARTGLLTTAGFIDVLTIAREARYDHYDLQIELPKPLVKRSWRRGITERIDSEGKVRTPLDREQLLHEIASLRDAGVESIAICYLHAHKNGEHEAATAALIEELAPDLAVSCSYEVAPEIREYERTSTTVINAYLQPIVERYLARLATRLTRDGRGRHASFNAVQRSPDDRSASTAISDSLDRIGSGGRRHACTHLFNDDGLPQSDRVRYGRDDCKSLADPPWRGRNCARI